MREQRALWASGALKRCCMKPLSTTWHFCGNIIRSMSTSSEDVIFKTVGNKGLIILNRPNVLNAITLSIVSKMYYVLKAWEREKSLVIVKGSGTKAFCAGGDIKVSASGGPESSLARVLARHEYTLNGLIGTYKIPYIALGDGIVMGGGVGLYAHGRYRVATERSVLSMPEIQIGHFPDVGASYFLSRLKGKLGLLLALTGYRLKGAELLEAGFATHYVDGKSLERLEGDLLTCDGDVKSIEGTLEKYSVEGDCSGLTSILDRIDSCFSAESVEEIILNLEKDGSQWGQEVRETLRKMPPTSLKITMKELEFGSKMTLQECLQMEYRMTMRSFARQDFYEGVRALLIDKDRTPKWNPASLSDVTPALVESFFTKLPEEQELKLRT